MSYKPSDAYCKEFTTASPTTGAAANADSLPVATANRNGTDDSAFVLTVANLDTGRYKITGTVPSGYVKGDVLNVSVAATVGGVAGKAVVDTQVLDSKRVGDLNDIAATAVVSGGAITTSGGKVSGVAVVDAVTTYTGNTPQTGDAFARIGTPAGASLSADVAAVNAKTANLPAAPADETLLIAATNSIMSRLGAPVGASISADIQTRSTYAGGDTSGTTTLLGRLTATRAGYIDNLSAGAVALASQIPANFTSGLFVSPGVFSVGALVNAPTGSGGGSGASLVAIQGELDARGLTASLTTTIITNLNATVSSRSTYAGGAVASVTDRTGFSLSSAGLDQVAVETLNARQALAEILDACTGPLTVPSGAGNVLVKNGAGVTRATVAVDGAGNRTAVTYAPPA